MVTQRVIAFSSWCQF